MLVISDTYYSYHKLAQLFKKNNRQVKLSVFYCILGVKYLTHVKDPTIKAFSKNKYYPSTIVVNKEKTFFSFSDVKKK